MGNGVRQVLRTQQAFEHLAGAVRQRMLRLKLPFCRYRQAIIHIHYIVKIPLDNFHDRFPKIMRGDDVVQLYFTVEDSEVTRPIKKLCGFARVHIGAGETRTVRLEVPEHILRIYDTHSGKMIVEDGSYTFFAGASSQDIRLTAELHISGEKISLRGDSFEAQSFDKGNNLGISYSRKAAQHYIVHNGWDAFAVYGGVNFSGKTSVTLKASAFVGDCETELSVGDISFKMSIPSSDGKDDIGSFTTPLPQGLPDTGELRITLPSGLMLLEISLS